MADTKVVHLTKHHNNDQKQIPKKETTRFDLKNYSFGEWLIFRKVALPKPFHGKFLTDFPCFDGEATST